MAQERRPGGKSMHMRGKVKAKASDRSDFDSDSNTNPQLKPELHSVATTPFKIRKCSSAAKVWTKSLYKPSKQYFYVDDQDDANNSDTDFVSSIPHRSKTAPERKLTEMEKQQQKKIIESTISKIKSKSRHYIGIPEGYLFLLDVIQCITGMPAPHVFMCLKKIKLNNSFRELADDFGMTPCSAKKIFFKNVPSLATIMHKFGLKLNKLSSNAMPMAFSNEYEKVTCIIQILQFKVQKQLLDWNQSVPCSEHAEVIKFLVAHTPNGVITYISSGYKEKVTDTHIAKTSGLIKVLRSGMCVMVDKGFEDIELFMNEVGIRVVRTPTVSFMDKLTKGQTKEMKQLNSLRLHVERVIDRIRSFNILSQCSCVNYHLGKVLHPVLIIVCSLLNLQHSLCNIELK